MSPTDLPWTRADLEVFMRVDASAEQIGALRKLVSSSPAVSRFAYVDHEAALAEFRQIFAQDPDLLSRVEAASLPVSFRLNLVPNASRSAATQRFQRMSGVDQVAAPVT